MAALGVISLGRVQRDGAKSAPELFGEIPVVATDLSDHGGQDFDGLDDDVEDLKRTEGRLGLHAPFQRQNSDSAAWGLASCDRRSRGSFAPGLASQAAPPRARSDPPTRTSARLPTAGS